MHLIAIYFGGLGLLFLLDKKSSDKERKLAWYAIAFSFGITLSYLNY